MAATTQPVPLVLQTVYDDPSSRVAQVTPAVNTLSTSTTTPQQVPIGYSVMTTSPATVQQFPAQQFPAQQFPTQQFPTQQAPTQPPTTLQRAYPILLVMYVLMWGAILWMWSKSTAGDDTTTSTSLPLAKQRWLWYTLSILQATVAFVVMLGFSTELIEKPQCTSPARTLTSNVLLTAFMVLPVLMPFVNLVLYETSVKDTRVDVSAWTQALGFVVSGIGLVSTLVTVTACQFKIGG